jgi:ankyrin repeat protein
MDAAFQQAIEAGDTQALSALIERGASVDARDRHGQTGVMRAAHAGRPEVVALLIAEGADLNVTAKYGLSALMLAVVAGHTEIARLLAAAGADRTLSGSGAPGFAGKTASDLAAAQGMHALAVELTP